MTEKELLYNEIRKSLDMLKTGGLVAFPSEIGWVVGCDTTNEEALSKISQLHKKQKSEDLILLVDNISKINNYLVEFPDVVWDLFDLAEKPIVLMLPGLRNLPEQLIHQNDSVGFMVAREGFSKMLPERLRKPLAIIQVEKELLRTIDPNLAYVVRISSAEKQESKPSVIKFGKGSIFKIIRS